MEPGRKSEAKQVEAGSGTVGSGGDSKVYHERQRLQFCLLHALNNLMQVASFSH
jgi:josephin